MGLANESENMKTGNGLIGILVGSAVVALGLTCMQAQSPVKLPLAVPPEFFEKVSESNLSRQYPDRPDLSNNAREIKKFLSSNSPYSMRLSVSTESGGSRMYISQQTQLFGTAETNLHYHINFSSSQFLVEELDCPPNSYPLNIWQPVNNEAKIRSDGFFDGKYYVMMPRGDLLEMEFDDLDAFKQACIAMRHSGLRPDNTVLQQAAVDFGQYARFQNVGSEAIVPNSFTFTGNNFSCLGMRGDLISGSLYTNAAGLVDEISYKRSEHYGSRIIFLFYETLFTNCPWYPSRIVDASKQGNNLYGVRAIYTVHNVYAQEGALPIPNTTDELYNTNTERLFEFSNDMAYQLIGTQLVAQPSLVQRHPGPSPGKRNSLGFYLIGSVIVLAPLLIFFVRKNR